MSAPSTPPERWSDLEPGDRIRVVSHSGRTYEATFLALGAEEATGIYVRLADGRLARFSPARLVAATLRTLGSGEVLKPGDELLFSAGGVEVRGALSEVASHDLVVRSGEKTIRYAVQAVSDLRLLFAASDLQPGDEFLVRSRSGRTYRGHAVRVEVERIVARLAGAQPVAEPVALRTESLDMRTAFVLVPVLALHSREVTPLR